MLLRKQSSKKYSMYINHFYKHSKKKKINMANPRKRKINKTANAIKKGANIIKNMSFFFL